MDAIETEDELTSCDYCNGEMTQAAYDADEGICPVCFKDTVVCSECCDRVAKSEVHGVYRTMCDGCGEQAVEDARQARVEKLQERLHDLASKVADTEDEVFIGRVIDAIRTIKRGKRKS